MDVLSPQFHESQQVNAQFELMTNTPEMQEFGLTAEANEFAFQQAMAYQGFESLDLLGLLDGEDADQVFDTLNEVNLSVETLTVEGIENAVHAQRAAFAAERAAEDIQRLRDAEDDADSDEEERTFAWAA